MLDKLPNELFVQILGNLSFDCVQKTCTLVSKKWFEVVRNSVELSGKVKFLHENVPKFDAIIRFLARNWPKIHTISLTMSEDKGKLFLVMNTEKTHLPNMVTAKSCLNLTPLSLS